MFLSRLFGKKNTPPPPSNPSRGASSTIDQIGKIENTIEVLEKRIKLYEDKIELESKKAIDLKNKGKKDSALRCMSQIKAWRNQVTNYHSQLLNMETIKMNLQEAKINQEILKAQMAGTAELEQLNREMNADKVAEQRDKMQELIDEQKAVTEALTQPLEADVVDEDDLLNELNNLQLEADKTNVGPVSLQSETVANDKVKHPAVNVIPDLGPSVPSGKIQPSAETEDEKALRIMEEELNS